MTAHPAAPPAGQPGGHRVLYVLKRFPRLSETFILRELLELEALGATVGVDSLLPREIGPVQAECGRLRARVRYLPRRPRLWRPSTLAAHTRLAGRHPGRWLSVAARAARHGGWRTFLRAGLVADRALVEGYPALHAHFATAAAEVARDAGALTGLPVTVTAHAKDVFAATNAAVLPDRLRGVRAVVTVSRFNAAHLRGVLPGVPVHLVPNGVALAPPLPAPADGPVLCIARLVAKKGVDVLLRAVAVLPADVRLEVVGGGPLAGELRALARELGVADRVRFTGPLPFAGPGPSVLDALARCSVVALAARVAPDGDRDGLPTVLVEAMARGLPVVSTTTAGIPELVVDEVTGLLVPSDEPAAMAAALHRLRSDRLLAARLGAAARRHVARHYAPRDAAVRLQAVQAGLTR